MALSCLMESLSEVDRCLDLRGQSTWRSRGFCHEERCQSQGHLEVFVIYHPYCIIRIIFIIVELRSVSRPSIGPVKNPSRNGAGLVQGFDSPLAAFHVFWGGCGLWLGGARLSEGVR